MIKGFSSDSISGVTPQNDSRGRFHTPFVGCVLLVSGAIPCRPGYGGPAVHNRRGARNHAVGGPVCVEVPVGV